jgi:hypothetical protein
VWGHQPECAQGDASLLKDSGYVFKTFEVLKWIIYSQSIKRKRMGKKAREHRVKEEMGTMGLTEILNFGSQGETR